MKIHKANWLLLIVSSVALAGCTSTSQNSAKQNPNAYAGKWDGISPTSLEIITENPLLVRYCFKSNCNNHKPTGTADNLTITFPPRGGRGKSTMNAVKSDTGYNATFQTVGSTVVNSATLTKPKLTPAQ